MADGDLLVVTAYLESDTNTWSSVPSGWNQDTTNLKQANTGSFQIQVFWKIAASEGASWSWTPTSNAWRVLAIAAYTGATGAGVGRRDVSGGSQADSVVNTSQTAPSVTTTAANDLVTFNYGNFTGTDITVMGGFCTNLRVTLGACCVTDANKAVAGATGTSNPTSGPGTDTYAAMHVGWLLDTGGTGDTQEWFPRQRAHAGPRTVNVSY